MITEDGVRVELIAVGTGYEYIDMYLLLEDMVGDRFVHDHWIIANHYIKLTDAPMLEAWARGRVVDMRIIDRDVDAGIVLLHSRLTRPRHHQYNPDLNPRNLTLNIFNIAHNSTSYGRQVVDVDMPALITESPPLRNIENHRLYVSAPTWNTLDDSSYILEPHTTNYRFEIEGLPVYISAIGVIDGRLHIQTYSPGSGNFRISHLLKPCGVQVFEYGAFFFGLDAVGDFTANFSISEEGHMVSHGRGRYVEHIFEIDLGSLEDVSIIGNFNTLDMINLNWVVDFELVGGVDAAPPTYEQPANQPTLPCMDELRRDTAIWSMIHEGTTFTTETSAPDWTPRRSFTCSNGITTYEEYFDTLPDLLVQYILYSFWEIEHGR